MSTDMKQHYSEEEIKRLEAEGVEDFECGTLSEYPPEVRPYLIQFAARENGEMDLIEKCNQLEWDMKLYKKAMYEIILSRRSTVDKLKSLHFLYKHMEEKRIELLKREEE